MSLILKNTTVSDIEISDLGITVPSSDLKEKLNDYENDEALDHVIGLVEIKWNDSYEVDELSSIWAKRGYGPLMYQIAMSVSENNELFPNRIPSYITNDAKKVWKEFFDGRGSDLVTYEEIEKEDFTHKELYLNCVYKIKKPLNLNKVKMNHKNFIGNDPYGEFETLFLEFTDGLLSSEMDSIYGN